MSSPAYSAAVLIADEIATAPNVLAKYRDSVGTRRTFLREAADPQCGTTAGILRLELPRLSMDPGVSELGFGLSCSAEN